MLNNVEAVTASQNVERLNQSVGLWLTDSMADALQRAARADSRNLSSYIRATLAQRLKREGYLRDEAAA